jgi:hypothetical protein
MASRTINLLYSLLLFSASTFAVTGPQCNSNSNGTTFDGEEGSEQQLNSTTVRKILAPDAIQGVAVDANYFYSINDYSITKHNKTTGKALLQWYGGEYGPIIHLDGGVVIDGILYAPHSNYAAVPITSSVEMWDTDTMEHIGSHSFGIYRGSLTWIDQDANGTWFGVGF